MHEISTEARRAQYKSSTNLLVGSSLQHIYSSVHFVCSFAVYDNVVPAEHLELLRGMRDSIGHGPNLGKAVEKFLAMVNANP